MRKRSTCELVGAGAAAMRALAVLVLSASPARTALPGANGKIAFGCGSQICVINADGTGRTQLTDFGFGTFNPSWSADGTK